MNADDMIMVHRFLDGELTTEELKLFEKKLAGNEEMAAYLEDLKSIEREFRTLPVARAPEVSFTRGLVPAVENFLGKRLSMPAWPVFAAASVAVVFLLLLPVYNRMPQRQVPPTLTMQEPAAHSSLRLVYFSREARSVTVVGDFNGWSEEIPLSKKNGSGYWAAELTVQPGEYQYAFVIDGAARVPDVTADFTIEDDYGSENSVLRVGL